jgi:pyruvate kinase
LAKNFQLDKQLTKLYNLLVEQESTASRLSKNISKRYRYSARNLYRYLLLRSYDLRNIHDALSDLGISSLRSSEGYVFSNVASALKLVCMLEGKEFEIDKSVLTIGYEKSKALLRRHARDLFGAKGKKHQTEIMVTMPDEADKNVSFLKELVENGMEIARINLSHGDLPQWKAMLDNLRKASKIAKKPIKIYMDLSGPKIRTEQIAVQNKKGVIKDFVKLKEGDGLILTKKKSKGRRAKYDDNGNLIYPAKVGVSLKQIIDDAKEGQRVFFDDGMIESRIIKKNKNELKLEITKAHKNKLKGSKGINLPDTLLSLPSLTETDIDNLSFVIREADIIGYSFVRTGTDVKRLYQQLDKLGAKDIGVVFKIENKEAFENLPFILLEGMKRKRIGVMIARGDLAVEIGFERISEVQEQILWICEAAHVPVIWATQVLENLAKTGMATRAEISDAAISAQAECVMLNKGPHIVEAVHTLKTILKKMQKHTSKKKSTLRMLKVAKQNIKSIHKQSIGKS